MQLTQWINTQSLNKAQDMNTKRSQFSNKSILSPSSHDEEGRKFKIQTQGKVCTRQHKSSDVISYQSCQIAQHDLHFSYSRWVCLIWNSSKYFFLSSFPTSLSQQLTNRFTDHVSHLRKITEQKILYHNQNNLDRKKKRKTVCIM
jgi:hypothetical protein